MTDQLPPISPDAVRVIVHAASGCMVAEFPVQHLEDLLDFSGVVGGPMPERTLEGSFRAVALYNEAMRLGEELIACGVALWISLHGGDLPAMIGGLNLGDLRAAAAAGNATITIYMSADGRVWEYLLSSDSGRQVGGRVNIDIPAWSKGAMGSA